jgi:hypothetical protein
MVDGRLWGSPRSAISVESRRRETSGRRDPHNLAPTMAGGKVEAKCRLNPAGVPSLPARKRPVLWSTDASCKKWLTPDGAAG